MPLLFNLFLSLGRICSVSAAGFIFFWNVSSVTSIPMKTSTCMITCLVAHMVINLSLQNQICHILKASTFCFHRRSGDIGSFRCRVVRRTLTCCCHCSRSGLVWQRIGCLHIQQLLRNRGAAPPYKCKYDICSLLAPHPSFKDSGSSAPAMLRSWLLHLPVVCR